MYTLKRYTFVLWNCWWKPAWVWKVYVSFCLFLSALMLLLGTSYFIELLNQKSTTMTAQKIKRKTGNPVNEICVSVQVSCDWLGSMCYTRSPFRKIPPPVQVSCDWLESMCYTRSPFCKIPLPVQVSCDWLESMCYTGSISCDWLWKISIQRNDFDWPREISM